MDGWVVNDDGGKKARGAFTCDANATAGKKSLAIEMMDGFKPGVRHDGPELAAKIKGHKLTLDVTAPEGSGEDFLQVAVAAVADGMDWKQVDPQDVPQDGKPHAIMLDVSSWPIPASPSWFAFFIITNTKENSRPRTIFVDNLCVSDSAAAPAAAAGPAAKQATPPLSSWEDGMDGWAINEDNGKKLARDAKQSDTGATDGKKSLAIDLLDAYHPAVKHDGPEWSPKLKGHKLAIDVTAPEGTAEGYLQVTFAAVADGMDWKAADLQEVPQDGKPHTLTFDISSWPFPASPQWFNFFLITNTQENTKPKTLYIDNLRYAD